MNIHNYTPYNITIRDNNGDDISIPSEGIARVDQKAGALLWIEGLGASYVPVFGPSQYGAVVGLPDPVAEGSRHYFIVSMMVAQALPDREDLLIPGTGPADGAIRENGQIVAITRLIATFPVD